MRTLACVALCITCLGVSAFSQAGYGTITGTVRDPTGAVVPTAKITVVDASTHVETKIPTSASGNYTAAQLSPGTYDVTAEADGFKRFTSAGIVVHVDDALTIDIPLQIGSASEEVTVTGETPLLRTEDAQTGEVVNNQYIMNLPQIDRNPFELLRISGNVQGAEGGIPANGQSQVRINGGRTSSIDYYVDGAVVTTGRAHYLSNQTPSMDAVQEFKVVTNGMAAEYGRVSGGFVELVTKGGTNSYHGDVYEFMFNDMFNANGWYQNAVGGAKTHFRQNDYGFTLGGPVSIPKLYNGKNKTFFFVDNEYVKRNTAGSIVLLSVPTAAERSGDFTNTIAGGNPTLMYDPYGPIASTPNADGTYSRLALLGGDGKHVPASEISPISAAILKLLPLPNRPSDAGYSSRDNYAQAQNASLYNFRLGARVDEVITDNQRLSIHFTRFSSNSGQTAVGGPLFTANTTSANGGDQGTVNYDWTARPTLLFNFRASVLFNPNTSGSTLPSNFNASSLGLPAIYASILGNNIPSIQTDFQNGPCGACVYSDSASSALQNSTSYDFAATGTKILNKHTVKFGAENRRYYDNFLNTGNGSVKFIGNPVAATSGDHGYSSSSSIPNSLGSFLLGINDYNTITGTTTRAMEINYNALFIQDDYKISRRLTINYGLRWDREGPTTERHDKLYFWDPTAPSLFTTNTGYSFANAVAAAGLNPANVPVPSWVTNGYPTGAIYLPNTPQFPSRNFQNVDNLQFAPRVGFAYKLNDKTVVRAYGGKMYLPTTGDPGGFSSAAQSLPLADAASAGWHASDDGGRHYISTWTNPFPQNGDVVTYSRDALTANKQASQDPGVTVFNKNVHMPREYEWTATVQRELPANFVLEGTYSANRGLGLLAPNLLSRFPASLFNPSYAQTMTTQVASPNAGQTLENSITGTNQYLGILEYPYPYYGTVNVLGSNIGSSFFNSLNVRLEHRMSHGFQFLLNYTYSHLVDDVGGPEADSTGGRGAGGQGAKQPQSIYTIQSTYGLSAFDQPHRLSLTYLYELPVGRGHRFLGDPQGAGLRVLDGVVGGWRVSGNSIYTSGTPVVLSGSTGVNINNSPLEVETIYGSYTSSNHNLANPSYTGDNASLVSPANGAASGAGRFDITKVSVPSRTFVAGNLPPVDPHLRNPPYYQTDLSIMKDFRLGSETRYLQLRGEAQNAFNIRGFGTYNNDIGNPQFGYITSAGNNPRQIQISARIIF